MPLSHRTLLARLAPLFAAGASCVAVVALVAVLGTQAACPSPSGTCFSNGDCGGFVCDFGPGCGVPSRGCFEGCEDGFGCVDGTCGDDGTCEPLCGDGPCARHEVCEAGVCVERPCADDSDCDSGRGCAPDGRCARQGVCALSESPQAP
jgi:hypothetical protein